MLLVMSPKILHVLLLIQLFYRDIDPRIGCVVKMKDPFPCALCLCCLLSFCGYEQMDHIIKHIQYFDKIISNIHLCLPMAAGKAE